MNPAMTFDIAAELNALIAAAGGMFEVRDMVAGGTVFRTPVERDARALAETWNGEVGRERYKVFPA